MLPKYYEFEVSLKGIKPRIWRRFFLISPSFFSDLHGAIQDAFGWEDCHLWEFRLSRKANRVLAGVPSRAGEDWGAPTPDGTTVKLDSYFTDNKTVQKCEYEYDFGDGWLHEVKLVGIHSVPEAFERRLLAGARACPPEDCGGPPGYDDCVQVSQTDEVSERSDWLGDWDPAAFDLEEMRAQFDLPRRRKSRA